MHDPDTTQRLTDTTLHFPEDTKQTINSINWISAALSDAGCVRQHNEDSMLERPDLGLWVVADGMGGYEAGDVASQMVVNALKDIPPEQKISKRVEEIEKRLLSVHAELQRMGEERSTTAGTTVIVLQAYSRHCVVMWAGDSRIYLYRQGKLRQFTQDHSLVDELVQRGEISPQEAENHPQANVITRAVGAHGPLFIDMDIMEVREGDVFLLCSDGLNKEVGDKEIETIMDQGDEHAVANKLIELVLKRGARDNVTVQVVRFGING